MREDPNLVSEEDLGVVGYGFNKFELEKLGGQLQLISFRFSHRPEHVLLSLVTSP